MKVLLSAALLPLLATVALAAPFTLSTGTASWTVSQTGILPAGNTSNTGGALNISTTAQILAGTLPGAWAIAPSGSAWVGQLSTDGGTPGAAPGVYQYVLTLVAGFGGSFNFDYTADNFMSLSITQGASTLLNVPAPGTNEQHASLTNTGSVNYGSGSNIIITATVTNIPFPGAADTARNPSGFLASGFGNTLDSAVPEPSSFVMLGLGAAALAAIRARRQ